MSHPCCINKASAQAQLLQGALDDESELQEISDNENGHCYNPTSWSWSSWTQAQVLGQGYKVTMYEFYYLSRTPMTMLFTTQGLWVIEGSSVYEGQESTYSGSEDLWRWSTWLCLDLETVRTMTTRDLTKSLTVWWRTRVYLKGYLWDIKDWSSKSGLDQVLRYIWVRLS